MITLCFSACLVFYIVVKRFEVYSSGKSRREMQDKNSRILSVSNNNNNNNNLLHLYSAFLDTQSALHSKGTISSSTTNVQHPPG